MFIQCFQDWNFRFQSLLDRPNSIDRAAELKKLCDEFYSAATKYCRTIIEEVSLPAARKTIQSVYAGGIAGGQKFIVGGIFIKVKRKIPREKQERRMRRKGFMFFFITSIQKKTKRKKVY